MKPIEPVRLLLVGLLLALAGWFATVLAGRFGWPTPVLPATALATMGVIVIITLVLGLRVRSWRNSLREGQGNNRSNGSRNSGNRNNGSQGKSGKPGKPAKKPTLDPLLAARTVVLAQACAYAGTVLLGWHAGIFLDQLRVWSLGVGADIAWLALAMAGGGLAMIAVGLLVEWFCRIPPDDSQGESPDTQGEAEGEGEYAYRGD
ncbi:DUF3180 domain-containing protein [Pseudarthrobacter sp. J64]|uniref:DUF3180 domain-containing protein n=1 Tax=Pseudarthrobacter sp. J64 TaxID=3116485 RepID=UPI002E81202E|nr:DUF3180 domain-containing protein [Pseudarthrobacter sp. J64]MEE2570288.1 DUF3180 domain-containing protein [Pseudarthrobacter sp. J64]